MTRYARAGKIGTHERVAKDPTPWNELKPPPPERLRGSKDAGGKRRPPKSFKKERFSRQKRPQEGEGDTSVTQSTSQTETDSATPRKSKGFNNNNNSNNIRGFGQSKSIKVFGQFWVPLEDGKRLKNLVKKLKEQGLPRKEIAEILKNDRRKAEKASKRQRDKTCYQCRQFGHVLSDCPNLRKAMALPGSENNEDDGSAEMAGEICFKCGSTEHTSRNCRKKGETFSFAKCFICSGTGHIARQCPKNTRGIYPSGGSCGECGSLNHLKKDCPDLVGIEADASQEDANAITLLTADPFQSTEYEPMTYNEGNDKEDDDDELSNSNDKVAEKGETTFGPKPTNKKANNNRKPKRNMNVELDSATFEFGLSSAPAPARPTPPAKRKIVKF